MSTGWRSITFRNRTSGTAMAQITWIHLGRVRVRGQGPQGTVWALACPPCRPRARPGPGWPHAPPVGRPLQGSSPEVAQAALLQGPDTHSERGTGRSRPHAAPGPAAAPAPGPYVSNERPQKGRAGGVSGSTPSLLRWRNLRPREAGPPAQGPPSGWASPGPRPGSPRGRRLSEHHPGRRGELPRSRRGLYTGNTSSLR